MKKTTLVLPSENITAKAFVKEAVISGRKIVATPLVSDQVENIEIADEDAVESSTNNDSSYENIPKTCAWNPLTFTSTRAVLLNAETQFDGKLDELVLICEPNCKLQKLNEMTPSIIENYLISNIAGYIDMIHEAEQHFEQAGAGTIILAIRFSSKFPLENMVSNALLGFAESILATRKSEKTRITVIKDDSNNPELLAGNIRKLLDEAPRDLTKIQKLSGRISLFGRF